MAILMDMAFARFFVLPSNVGDWLIYKEGVQRAVHRLADKANPVETARAMARAESPRKEWASESRMSDRARPTGSPVAVWRATASS